MQGRDIRTSIVCGVDGSPDSHAALTVAAGLAERLGARLVLAHVAERVLTPYAQTAPLTGSGTAGSPAVDEAAAQQEAGLRLLEQAADRAAIADAEYRVGNGLPAERLADIADEEDAELILVG